MPQVRGGLDLPQEPLGPKSVGQFGPEHLDRHLAVVLQVLGEVHRRHSASAQLAFEAVAVGQGGGEAVACVAHAWGRRLKPALGQLTVAEATGGRAPRRLSG